MKYQNQSPYEAVGGAETIEKLVSAFYARVAEHPDLAPIFPDDLTETARKQTQFLTQFLGGPPLYTEEHGHPRLRARHLRFPIGPKQERAWISCMKEAMEEIEFNKDWRDAILQRLALTAHHMVNQIDENS
ncbi:hemoglobin [Scopulibacillus daqui]|uniref:Hemoglobin n=1 Tax=Scopulibacillus daqui TaxID=1469162 RepID=A0ABS2PVF3_9BACL|nr:globin [Scopulibacillus daqui]MBM7644039.1 hemoglobin [Scopulibacillus daqui]